MLGNEALGKAPNTNVCFVILEQLIIYSFPSRDQKDVSLNEKTIPGCEHALPHPFCIISCFPSEIKLITISTPGAGRAGAALLAQHSGERRQEHHSKFKVGWIYIVSSRLAKAT